MLVTFLSGITVILWKLINQPGYAIVFSHFIFILRQLLFLMLKQGNEFEEIQIQKPDQATEPF
ncbi:hypothetical protein BO224_03235 [Erysipelotrichaceae bacterium NYU-BL-E8]|uniref:Uncharacterized protein n=1 Tax=Ileibacterium valens TaxID=1862668 RepID=A0A1U7NF51_9FIRM|nr:hypothetical protein BO222_08030 [Ileibacterium valens]OLU40845.1 hypothetical protein BM735_05050 [Erysipelotrichaceae bacterium NYU-BL-F16]OLU41569.1 hypothetical protein BO224_03235 [Erysipelotrichaceae bacterium NYU-BL-E8]